MYESRLYVVDKTTLHDTPNSKAFGKVVASVDMSSLPGLRLVFTETVDCYFYTDNGNRKVSKDEYGEPLKSANISDVIDFLEQSAKNDEIRNMSVYRRIKPAIGLLKGFKNRKNWPFITIVHYGH